MERVQNGKTPEITKKAAILDGSGIFYNVRYKVLDVTF